MHLVCERTLACDGTDEIDREGAVVRVRPQNSRPASDQVSAGPRMNVATTYAASNIAVTRTTFPIEYCNCWQNILTQSCRDTLVRKRLLGTRTGFEILWIELALL